MSPYTIHIMRPHLLARLKKEDGGNCVHCSEEFKAGDQYVSRNSNMNTLYRCVECARQLNIID